MIDTGSFYSLVTRSTVERIGVDISPIEVDDVAEFRTASGSSLAVTGTADLNIQISGLVIPHKVYVVEQLTAPMILGTTFLQQTSGVIDYSTGLLTLYDGMIQTRLIRKHDRPYVARLTNIVTIQPMSEALVRVKIPLSLRQYNVVATAKPGEQFRVFGLARSLIKSDKSGNAYVRILNPRSEIIILAKNRALADLVPVNIQNDKVTPIHPSAETCYIQKVQNPQLGGTNVKTVGNTEGQNKHDDHAHHHVTDIALEKFAQEYGFKIGNQLDAVTRRSVLKLLHEYKDIFARSTADIKPRKPDIDVPVEIQEHKMWNRRNYPMSSEQRDEAHKQILEMERSHIIERAKSFGYNSPILLLRKPSGGYRFLHDLRLANSILKAPTIALQNPQTILEEISTSKPNVYATFDLYHGYYNYTLPENVRKYTRFEDPKTGLPYIWRALPQGLSISPAIFLSNINYIFAQHSVPERYLYMDDLCLGCSDNKILLSRVREVFDICRQNGLRISSSKSTLFSEKVDFLGYTLTKDGIQPKVSKHQLLRQAKSPHNKKSLQSALGFLQFYRKFLPMYSQRTAGMRAMLRSQEKFEWTSENEKCYRSLLDEIFSLPTLKHIDKSKPFIVYVDASKFGAASSIFQPGADNKLHPVAHMSRAFSKAMQLWSTPRRELLALSMVLNTYQHFLLGAKIYCYTDAPMTQFIIKKAMITDSVVARIIENIMPYQITFRHVTTKANPVDAPSRWPELWTEAERSEWRLQDIEAFDEEDILAVRPQDTSVIGEGVLPVSSDNVFYTDHTNADSVCNSTVTSQLAEKKQTVQSVCPSIRSSPLIIHADSSSNERVTEPVSKLSQQALPLHAQQLSEHGAECATDKQDKGVCEVLHATVNTSDDDDLYYDAMEVLPTTDVDKDVAVLDGQTCYNVVSDLQILPGDYRRDAHLGPIYDYLLTGKQPSDIASLKEVLFTSHLYRVADDGKLYRLYSPRRKRKSAHNEELINEHEVLCIPEKHCLTILHTLHDLNGHYSDQRFLQTLRRYTYWKNQYTQAVYYGRTCPTCQKVKPNLHPVRSPLHSIPVGNKPWECLHLDFFNLVRPVDSFTNVLILVDQFSGFVILLPVKSVTALELCQSLVNIFSVFPLPSKSIFTDLGSAFTSELFKFLLGSLNIKHLKISSKHPQGNSACERRISETKQRLRALLDKDEDIVKSLPLVNLQLNTNTCSVRRLEPMEILFGDIYTRPQYIDQEIPRQSTQEAVEFLTNFKSKMADIWKEVKSNLERAKIKDERVYNKRFKTQTPSWQVGQKVLLQRKEIPARSEAVIVADKWTGPLKISKIINDKAGIAYRLSTLDGKELRYSVSGDRLKQFNSRNLNFFYKRDIPQEDIQDKFTQQDAHGRTDIQPETECRSHETTRHERRLGTNRRRTKPTAVENSSIRTEDALNTREPKWYDAVRILRDVKLSDGSKGFLVLFTDGSKATCDRVSQSLLDEWNRFKKRRALRKRLRTLRR